MTTEYYRHTARPRSQVSSPHQQEIVGEFLDRATSGSSVGRALDLGSGRGANLDTLAGFAESILAVDISPAALDDSRASHPHLHGRASFATVDGARLPFPDASFDLVMCTEVLEHVDDFVATTRELRRVTSPGGHLVVSTPNYRNVMGLVKVVKDWRSGRHDYDPWHAHAGGYEGFVTATQVRRAFDGCDVVAARGADYAFALGITWPAARRRLSKHLLLRPGRVRPLTTWGMQYYLLLRKR